MRINIGKWFRRQVTGGRPVTIGTALQLLTGRLGPVSDALDEAEHKILKEIARQKSTPDIIKSRLSDEVSKGIQHVRAALAKAADFDGES